MKDLTLYGVLIIPGAVNVLYTLDPKSTNQKLEGNTWDKDSSHICPVVGFPVNVTGDISLTSVIPKYHRVN